MFFIAVYIHMFRGLYYGSYKKPRELLWMFGVVIFLLMMATAFMGYTLPWGQMSFWGATVITNLFSALPIVGKHIVSLLWGGFSVDNPTLNRFFALHYLLPFVLFAVVFLHVWALHIAGSNNPLGIEPKSEKDTLPFHPYYTMKDGFGVAVFLMIYALFVFYAPNLMGHADNYIKGDPLVTPPHIVPEWYFLPFYAILRSIPDKLLGVLAMGASIIILFFLPWLDTSKVRSLRFRPIMRWWFLDPGRRRDRTRLCRRQSAGRLLDRPRSDRDLLLLPSFPGDHAVDRQAREAAAAAGFDRRSRAWGEGVMLMRSLALAATLVAGFVLPAAANDEIHIPKQEWHHDGAFGTYDRAQLQRGFQIYSKVCSTCHAMSLLSYRHLAALGYGEAELKAIAGFGHGAGRSQRPGRDVRAPGSAERPVQVAFPQRQAARAANNGALPKGPVVDGEGA